MTRHVARSNLGDVMGSRARRPTVLAVIPARIGSSRLPRKPLHPLAGRPLIEWVWRRVVGMNLFDATVIATDDDEICEVARRFGAVALLTSESHPSGTDRVAEVARMAEYRRFGVLINIQGDEPFIARPELEGALRLVSDARWPIGTAAAPITRPENWRDPAVVKVVHDDRGRALLFSRAPIPHPREGEPDLGSGRYLRHVGVYAYTREALLQWVAFPEHPLEQIERLEQLRPTAAGLRIGVHTVASAEGGIDTPEDARRADQRLRDEFSLSVNGA